MCTVQSTNIVNIVRWTIPACKTILSPANRGLSLSEKKAKDAYSFEATNLHFERLYEPAITSALFD